jgi:hypothetical protein
MANPANNEAAMTVPADHAAKRLMSVHALRAQKVAISRTASSFAPSKEMVATTVDVEIATATIP